MYKDFKLSDFKYSRLFFDLKPFKGIQMFTLLFFLLIIIGCIFIYFAEIDEVVKVDAVLRPANTISNLYCISGGKMESKRYTNGSFVNKGDLLWELDIDAEKIALNNSKRLLKIIEKDIDNYTILLETLNSNTNMAPSDNEEAWIICVAWLGELHKLELKIIEAKNRLNRELALPDNMKSSQSISDLELVYENSLVNLRVTKAQQIVNCIEKLKKLKNEYQENLRMILELEKSIANSSVLAPIAGIINEINEFNEGDYVVVGQEVLRIIPQDSTSLKVELSVDPTDIARIHSGQKVYLRFPALPPSDFGQLEATISYVPVDIKFITSNIASFIVEADIPNAILTASNGDIIHLRSGMGAQARVVIKKETLFKMILHRIDFLGDDV